MNNLNWPKTSITEDGLFHSESPLGYYWYVDSSRDQRHRYDGPAIVIKRGNTGGAGSDEYYWLGRQVSEKEHQRLAAEHFANQDKILDFTF